MHLYTPCLADKRECYVGYLNKLPIFVKFSKHLGTFGSRKSTLTFIQTVGMSRLFRASRQDTDCQWKHTTLAEHAVFHEV
jgi:hypothetical protein